MNQACSIQATQTQKSPSPILTQMCKINVFVLQPSILPVPDSVEVMSLVTLLSWRIPPSRA